MAGAGLLLLTNACNLLFHRPENPLKKHRGEVVTLVEDMEAIPRAALFGFVPEGVAEEDLWIGRALGYGAATRIGPGMGVSIAEPDRFSSLIGVAPYRLDGLPDEVEVELLLRLMTGVHVVFGAYSVDGDQVTARILEADGVRLREVHSETVDRSDLGGLADRLAERFVDSLPDRHCEFLGREECEPTWHDDRLPDTAEGIEPFARALAYLEARWLDNEAEELERLLLAEPGFLLGAKMLIRNYQHRGQIDEMAAVLAGFSGADDDADIQFYLGTVHYLRGELEEAQAAFTRALALDEGLNQARVFLASIADSTGDQRLRTRMVSDFLQTSDDGGILRNVTLRMTTFQNQPEVLTLQERWRDRILPSLPPGSTPDSIDWVGTVAGQAVVTDAGRAVAGLPRALAADADGLWVGVDYHNGGELIRFDWEGNLVERLQGPLLRPVALAWHKGRLYVADERLDQIFVLTDDGLEEFSQAVNKVRGLASDGERLLAVDGQRASVIALDDEGEILDHFILARPPGRLLPQPRDLTVDEAGRSYVPDLSLGAVVVYGPDGEEVGRVGRPGAGPGEMDMPHGIDFVDGWLFAVDLRHARLQAWDGDGRVRMMFGSELVGRERLTNPFDVAVSPDRTRAAVSDTDNHRLLLLDLAPAD